MTWQKQNLVTQKDSEGYYDEYRCSACGFKKRYYSFVRETICPKCSTRTNIMGCWHQGKLPSVCPYCNSEMVECPKQGHPNSQFWNLQRGDYEKLMICPKGCSEDGKTRFEEWDLTKPRKRVRTRWPR